MVAYPVIKKLRDRLDELVQGFLEKAASPRFIRHSYVHP
jgi:hypothetical protein